MTREDLHYKSDIAAELGYRDMVIDRLTKENQKLFKNTSKLVALITNLNYNSSFTTMFPSESEAIDLLLSTEIKGEQI